MSGPPPTLGQQCVITVLCQGKTADGQAYWAYLEMESTRVKNFKKAQKQGSFRLQDHGTIVAWGMGEEVPPEDKERMEREQGVSHDFQKQAMELASSSKKQN